MKRRAYEDDHARDVAALAGELKIGLLRAIAADDERDRRHADAPVENSFHREEDNDGDR